MAPASRNPNPNRWVNSRPTPFMFQKNLFFESNKESALNSTTYLGLEFLMLEPWLLLPSSGKRFHQDFTVKQGQLWDLQGFRWTNLCFLPSTLTPVREWRRKSTTLSTFRP